jgi:subtilisin family serine protease
MTGLWCAAVAVSPLLLPITPAESSNTRLPLQGRHVLVGIVDSGIDYANADFKHPDGTTRIRYIWDQTQDGRPPAGYDVGYECDAASINSGECPERDTDGHGTVVAGIAAGNGRSGGAQASPGLAPQADLVVVKSDLETEHVIAAWQYMVSRAKQLREPIVINNSFGDQNGPHDGTEQEAQAIDALSGPGVVFVAAAGNDGNQGIHTGGRVTQGKQSTLTVTAHGTSQELALSLFYSSQDDFVATLSSVHTGQTFGPIDVGARLDTPFAQDSTIHVTLDAHPPDPAHHAIVVDLYTTTPGRSITGSWRLSLTGKQVINGGRYNAWLLTSADGIQTFAKPQESDTLDQPADARAAITVSHYATHTQWTDRNGRRHGACDYLPCAKGVLRSGAVSFNSSVGPTADGRHKPDIAAPGVLIASSLSANVPICHHNSADLDNCIDPVFITRDGKHMIESGSSMASAYVAGAVALILQASPSSGPDDIRAILRSTARHDRFTGKNRWTPTFGAGKIDALAAVRKAIAPSRPRVKPFMFRSVLQNTRSDEYVQRHSMRPVYSTGRFEPGLRSRSTPPR